MTIQLTESNDNISIKTLQEQPRFKDINRKFDIFLGSGTCKVRNQEMPCDFYLIQSYPEELYVRLGARYGDYEDSSDHFLFSFSFRRDLENPTRFDTQPEWVRVAYEKAREIGVLTV